MSLMTLLALFQPKPTDAELRQFHNEQRCSIGFAGLPRIHRIFVEV